MLNTDSYAPPTQDERQVIASAEQIVSDAYNGNRPIQNDHDLAAFERHGVTQDAIRRYRDDARAQYPSDHEGDFEKWENELLPEDKLAAATETLPLEELVADIGNIGALMVNMRRMTINS